MTANTSNGYHSYRGKVLSVDHIRHAIVETGAYNKVGTKISVRTSFYLELENGTERRFEYKRDVPLRPGHEVVVLVDSSRSLVGVVNLTTCEKVCGSETTPRTMVIAILGGLALAAFVNIYIGLGAFAYGIYVAKRREADIRKAVDGLSLMPGSVNG